MADVFVSYSHVDHAVVGRLADLLARNGWDVWWDRSLLPGDEIAGEIYRELANATVIVVLWSQNSITSDWVIAEAKAGLQRDCLMPIRITQVENLPADFRLIHTIDLTGWTGNVTDKRLDAVFGAVHDRVRGALESTEPRMEQLGPRVQLVNATASRRVFRVPFVDGDHLVEFKVTRVPLVAPTVKAFVDSRPRSDLQVKTNDNRRHCELHCPDGSGYRLLKAEFHHSLLRHSYGLVPPIACFRLWADEQLVYDELAEQGERVGSRRQYVPCVVRKTASGWLSRSFDVQLEHETHHVEWKVPVTWAAAVQTVTVDGKRVARDVSQYYSRHDFSLRDGPKSLHAHISVHIYPRVNEFVMFVGDRPVYSEGDDSLVGALP